MENGNARISKTALQFCAMVIAKKEDLVVTVSVPNALTVWICVVVALCVGCQNEVPDSNHVCVKPWL